MVCTDQELVESTDPSWYIGDATDIARARYEDAVSSVSSRGPSMGVVSVARNRILPRGGLP